MIAMCKAHRGGKKAEKKEDTFHELMELYLTKVAFALNS